MAEIRLLILELTSEFPDLAIIFWTIFGFWLSEIRLTGGKDKPTSTTAPKYR